MTEKLPVSIVIPAKNESKLLPRLLKSIQEQTIQPLEVIVADAFSTDDTREIARRYKAKVIDGGKLSIGRNNGAKEAKGEIIFFMDADAKLPDDKFLKRVYDNFIRSKSDIGSTLFKIDDESKKYPVAVIFYNIYVLLKLVSSWLKEPFIESGLFLISTREAFARIGGFKDVKHGIPEDLEYMLHGIHLGMKYTVLHDKIIGSARRYYNFFSAVKTVMGAILCGWVVKFNLYDKEKFVDLSSKMYGELGGKDKNAEEKKWDAWLADSRSKISNYTKVSKTVAVLGAFLGAGFILLKLLSPHKRRRKRLD